MPRHASTHAAGVVITKDPVYTYVPLGFHGSRPVEGHNSRQVFNRLRLQAHAYPGHTSGFHLKHTAALGQADMVRRAMSKKKAKDIAKEQQAFLHGDQERHIAGCVANGKPVKGPPAFRSFTTP